MTEAADPTEAVESIHDDVISLTRDDVAQAIRQLAKDFATLETYRDLSNVEYHISELAHGYGLTVKYVRPRLQGSLEDLFEAGQVAESNRQVVQKILSLQ